MYYAHSKGDDKSEWEPLIEHLKNVTDRCEAFSRKFGAGDMGRICGLLHDIGKYSDEFAARLEGKPVRVEHSIAGAKEAREIFSGAFATLFGYVIAGHHAGLPNYGTVNEEGSLARRLSNDMVDYLAYKCDVDVSKEFLAWPESLMAKMADGKSMAQIAYSLFFLTKMLFSCLVDADFLETERFMDKGKSAYRKGYPSLTKLSELFDNSMAGKRQSAPKTALNENRNKILDACLQKAELPPGLFSLTVPTGGGKTLSSMAFALRHAIKYGMDRIIYVIPYTSIIEQTAAEFKNIFGEENVLEHHSNFDFQKPFDYENDLEGKHIEHGAGNSVEQMLYSMKLAAENWDAPIIVTTNVQFFESMYANKTSRSRKLHNTASSVIIFDEAQLLPIDYLLPSLECVCELKDKYHVSAVLCTATQPAIDRYLRAGAHVEEIVSADVYDPTLFKRVKFVGIGRISAEALADRLCGHRQVLCIVSTKKLAQKIYEGLPTDGRYHLSGNMCTAHRSEMLGKIKARLVAGAPVFAVTTQLVEAGVDIDFPVVYRQLAGLDSIIQAAGRCNREGKLPSVGEVLIFETEGEKLPKGFLGRTASIGAETIRKFDYGQMDSDEAIGFYFRKLYTDENKDKDGVMDKIRQGIDGKVPKFSFKDIARDFRLIKNDTVPIIVPYDDDAKRLIAQLEFEGNRAARKLQKYTVNVYGSDKGECVTRNSDFQKLLDSGGVRVIADTYYVLSVGEVGEDTFYSGEVGLR